MHGQELLLEAEVVVEGRAQGLLVDQRTQGRLMLANGLQPVLHLLGKAIDLGQAARGGNAGLVAAQAVVFGSHGARMEHAGQGHIRQMQCVAVHLRQLQPGYRPQNRREQDHDEESHAQLRAHAPICHLHLLAPGPMSPSAPD